jgi:ADP-heptose:LPS heptosyltransferase
MLTESGIPADPARIRLRTPPVIVPPHLRDATVIHPGAASEARRWPLERWVQVARAARQIGPVVVTGSRTERARTSALVHAAGIASAYDVAGRTDLLELAALVAHAGRVVCSDTGMAHLATAFGIPSVVLFGPTSPDDWGPRPNDGRHIVLWHGLRGDPHANTIDAGLLRIASDDVIAALHSLPGVSAIQPSA